MSEIDLTKSGSEYETADWRSRIIRLDYGPLIFREDAFEVDINWSAIGAVSCDRAEAFANDLLRMVKRGREIEAAARKAGLRLYVKGKAQ